MLPKPLAFVLREAGSLRGVFANISCFNGEVEDDEEISESAVSAPETTIQGSSRVQRDQGSSDRREEVDEHGETNFNSEQEAEASNQTMLNVTGDGNAEGEPDDGVIYSVEQVEHMGQSFILVATECYSVIPSTEHDAEAGDIINRTIGLSSRMARRGAVQRAVFEEAAADSSFLGHANALGQNLMELRNSFIRNDSESSVDEIDAAEMDLEELVLDDTDVVDDNLTITEKRSVGSNDEGAPSALPWYRRFLDALKKLCQKLYKLGSQAINLVVSKIRACFNVTRAVAQKIFRAIRTGLLWIRKAIVDPQGQIREILDDPERSSCVKALGVIGVVATAIIGALIVAFGVVELGPIGVGAAAISAVAAASVAVRKAPAQDPEHH